MAEKNSTPPPSRWRCDGVVLALLLATGLMSVAVGSSRAVAGGPNRLGTWGEAAATLLLDPLGWGVVVFLVSGWAIAGELVVHRSVGRLALRLGGWWILTMVAAVGADAFGRGLPSPAVAGRGGSLGAYLLFWLEDTLQPPWVAVVVAVAGWLGAWLAVPHVVLGAAHALGYTVRQSWYAAVWLNDRIADGMDAVLRAGGGGLKRLAGFIVRCATASSPPPPPQTVEADIPLPPPSAPLALAEECPDDDNSSLPAAKPEDIPIHRHTGPKLPPASQAIPATPEGSTATDYQLPPLSLLNDPKPFPIADHEQKLRDMAVLLEKTFQDFGLNVKVVGIHTGPVVTQYEIALETGLRLNKVTNLADDLALNLRVASVRVVAPLPGRNTVGIEVPNEIRQTVYLKELVAALAHTPKVAKFKLPLFIGKDVEGRPLAYDLATMPHLLIAGSTGTGKSVCLNTIIVSLLLTRRPDECRMILIDPKKVELSDYAHIPHLMTPVVKEDKKADAILAWAVEKMEERYEWLHRARVRNIASYNELPFEEIVRRVNPDSDEEWRAIPRKMPYIVIIIDEVGDLMMKMKKEIEGNIILLAQKSRAAGIHLVLATQKPTVDVVTGLIKSNLPARICFRVTNRSDSAVVLDEKGGERLLGEGDMLFLQTGQLTRAQGAYVANDEIERVVNAIATDTPNYDTELLNLKTRDQLESVSGGELGAKLRERDPLYEQAVEIIIREQRGSTSLLQRALGIGYGKASRFIDYMAEDGIVGGYNGSNARHVLISPEEWEARKAGMMS
ncbi:MAG: DNA translocase FtsK [Gemmataceae bacterium]|nr:DNA translocase FtsK [Gemmata sp.]MDW8196213.1 DNA translocase FtsK [Gemmataceae bacterium]